MDYAFEALLRGPERNYEIPPLLLTLLRLLSLSRRSDDRETESFPPARNVPKSLVPYQSREACQGLPARKACSWDPRVLLQ
jgi:hypothetical protein